MRKELGAASFERVLRSCTGKCETKWVPKTLEPEVPAQVSLDVNYGVRLFCVADFITLVQAMSVEVATRVSNFERVNVKAVSMTLLTRRSDAPVEPSKPLGHGWCDKWHDTLPVTPSCMLPTVFARVVTDRNDVRTLLRHLSAWPVLHRLVELARKLLGSKDVRDVRGVGIGVKLEKEFWKHNTKGPQERQVTLGRYLQVRTDTAVTSDADVANTNAADADVSPVSVEPVRGIIVNNTPEYRRKVLVDSTTQLGKRTDCTVDVTVDTLTPSRVSQSVFSELPAAMKRQLLLRMQRNARKKEGHFRLTQQASPNRRRALRQLQRIVKGDPVHLDAAREAERAARFKRLEPPVKRRCLDCSLFDLDGLSDDSDTESDAEDETSRELRQFERRLLESEGKEALPLWRQGRLPKYVALPLWNYARVDQRIVQHCSNPLLREFVLRNRSSGNNSESHSTEEQVHADNDAIRHLTGIDTAADDIESKMALCVSVLSQHVHYRAVFGVFWLCTQIVVMCSRVSLCMGVSVQKAKAPTVSVSRCCCGCAICHCRACCEFDQSSRLSSFSHCAAIAPCTATCCDTRRHWCCSTIPSASLRPLRCCALSRCGKARRTARCTCPCRAPC
ncbi:MAG: hypothetical protein MHM6MM_006342 [Cercozoa sp. M6MM]